LLLCLLALHPQALQFDRQKAFGRATLDSGLNVLPVIGGVKSVYETARGRDPFPDRRSGIAPMRMTQSVRRRSNAMAPGWESKAVEAQQSERSMLMLARSRAQLDL
jgi:hypothetical protein